MNTKNEEIKKTMNELLIMNEDESKLQQPNELMIDKRVKCKNIMKKEICKKIHLKEQLTN